MPFHFGFSEPWGCRRHTSRASFLATSLQETSCDSSQALAWEASHACSSQGSYALLPTLASHGLRTADIRVNTAGKSISKAPAATTNQNELLVGQPSHAVPQSCNRRKGERLTFKQGSEADSSQGPVPAQQRSTVTAHQLISALKLAW